LEVISYNLKATGLTAKQKIPRTTRKRLTTLFDPIDRQRWLQTYYKNHATTF